MFDDYLVMYHNLIIIHVVIAYSHGLYYIQCTKMIMKKSSFNEYKQDMEVWLAHMPYIMHQ